MIKTIDKQHINQTNRGKLAKVMEKATCYLLEGELAKDKRQDFDGLTVLADYGGRCEIIQDTAAGEGEGEYFRRMELSRVAMGALTEILTPKPQKPNWGRPKKYGRVEEYKAKKMQKDGVPLREIARNIGCSLSTLQRLLGKRYPVPKTN